MIAANLFGGRPAVFSILAVRVNSSSNSQPAHRCAIRSSLRRAHSGRLRVLSCLLIFYSVSGFWASPASGQPTNHEIPFAVGERDHPLGHRFGPSEGLPAGPSRAIAIGPHGRIYVGTDQGLFFLEPEERLFRAVQGFAERPVGRIAVAGLWVGSRWRAS